MDIADRPQARRVRRAPKPAGTDDQTAQLAAAVALADSQAGLETALRAALDLLEPREEAWAGPLRELLERCFTRLAQLPPLHDGERLPVHYDDQLAHCFEQLVALIRAQDGQLAEMQAIVSELI